VLYNTKSEKPEFLSQVLDAESNRKPPLSLETIKRRRSTYLRSWHVQARGVVMTLPVGIRRFSLAAGTAYVFRQDVNLG
jgi:hypothetical protein